MNIPTFINENGFETAIKPWHRPDWVTFEFMEPPPLSTYHPTNFAQQCCCVGGFGGGGGYYSGPINTPVPEIGTGFMMLAGVIMIVLVKKWKAK